MPGKHLSFESKEAIRAKVADGEPRKQVAAEFLVSLGTVNRVVNFNGLPAEIEESTAFEKALTALECRFPGAIERIKSKQIRITQPSKKDHEAAKFVIEKYY